MSAGVCPCCAQQAVPQVCSQVGYLVAEKKRTGHWIKRDRLVASVYDNQYLSAWRGGLTGARGDGHGEILAVWSGLKLDRGVGPDTDFALYLCVAVGYELHGVFGVSIIHFNGE